MTDFPRWGQIYWVDFSPVLGSEQAGKRPAVVVSNEVLNQHGSVVVVVPITSQPAKRIYPHEVALPAGAIEAGRVLCNQVRTVTKERVGNHLADLTDEQLSHVNRALALILSLKTG